MEIHNPIILSVVSYEYETSSLTLSERHGLRMIWNRVLREIFLPRSEEVTGVGKNCMTVITIICVLCHYY
jgi:hypothetical protein